MDRSSLTTMTRLNEGAQRWLQRLNESQHALWLLAAMSFLETIIVPIPIEIVLIPFMLANRRRIWTIAAVTTAGCLVASLVGYGVGSLLYRSAGVWLIETTGHEATFEAFRQLFDRHGFVAILAVGILPIPFQLAMIVAGLSGYPIYLFVAAALVARGIRYFGLAWLVHAFGDRARELWDRHALITSLTAAAIVAIIVVAGNYAADRVV